ncbi:MAG: ribosome maturation factor RimP, partial [Pseudomonadota bacterium]
MLDTALQQLFEPAVTALGYELVGVERLSFGRRGALLRVYIDSPTGITVDDCGRVSHQISGILDVEEPIKSDYTLEVSSPGLDRPLFALEHYVRFVGKEVSLRLHRPI